MGCNTLQYRRCLSGIEIFAPLVLLLTLNAAIAQDNASITTKPTIEKTSTRMTRANQPVELTSHIILDKDCRGKQLVKILLTAPPLHGSVCVEVAQLKHSLPTVSGSKKHSHCVGKQMRGSRIVYISSLRFSGEEKVRYTVEFPRAELHRTVNVIVKRAANSMYKDGPLAETPLEAQRPGPMPPCVQLVS